MESPEEVIVYLNPCGSITWLEGKDCYVFSIALVALNMMTNKYPRIPFLVIEG